MTFCQEMHQITQLLFADLFNKGGLGRGEVMEALEDVGLSLESVGRLITFKYEDGASLHVQLCFYPDDRLHHVSLSIGIEGDVKSIEVVCQRGGLPLQDGERGTDCR